MLFYLVWNQVTHSYIFIWTRSVGDFVLVLHTNSAYFCIFRCVICMLDFVYGDPIRFLPCMHIYHMDCIDDWLMRSFTCPSCMEPVDAALLSTYETNWYFTCHPEIWIAKKKKKKSTPKHNNYCPPFSWRGAKTHALSFLALWRIA